MLSAGPQMYCHGLNGAEQGGSSWLSFFNPHLYPSALTERSLPELQVPYPYCQYICHLSATLGKEGDTSTGLAQSEHELSRGWRRLGWGERREKRDGEKEQRNRAKAEGEGRNSVKRWRRGMELWGCAGGQQDLESFISMVDEKGRQAAQCPNPAAPG